MDLKNFKFKEANISGPTIGQFLHYFDRKPIPCEEKKTAVLQDMMPPASKWVEAHIKEDLEWSQVKLKLIQEFRSQLNVREKVELRRSLQQQSFESCQDFLNRCTRCQFLVCDDEMENVLERDILINFLLGLREEFYEALIEMDNLQTLESFFCEAVKLEAMIQVKEEINIPASEEEDNDITIPSKIVKSEHIQIEPKVEDLDQHDSGADDDFASDADPLLDIKEEPLSKVSKSKKRKKFPIPDADEDSDADSDFDPEKFDPAAQSFPCEFCGKVYRKQSNLDKHVEQHHPKSVQDPDMLIKCGFCDLSFTARRCLTYVCILSFGYGLAFSYYIQVCQMIGV